MDIFKNEKYKEIISWVKTFLVCFIFVFIINHCIIVNAAIPSESMQNTVNPGDRIIASRLAYIASEPERGDIVVFSYPVDDALGKNTLYIKRVIGLPGETVKINDAKIYINGSDTPLDEPYLKEEWLVANDGLSFQVPEGYYFMLGDNRNISLDSRFWAEKAVEKGIAENMEEAEIYSYVSEDQIIGKAFCRYWPLNEITLLK